MPIYNACGTSGYGGGGYGGGGYGGGYSSSYGSGCGYPSVASYPPPMPSTYGNGIYCL